jgi:hypothetical protein
MNEFIDIDIKDLFKYSLEERKEFINAGVRTFMSRCDVGAATLGIDLNDFLDRALDSVDKQIEIAKEAENYELVWYFNEIVWGVHALRNENW